MLYFLIHVSNKSVLFWSVVIKQKIFEIKLIKCNLINEHILNRIINNQCYETLIWIIFSFGQVCDYIKVPRKYFGIYLLYNLSCYYWLCPCRQAAVKNLAILLNSMIAGHLRMLMYIETRSQKVRSTPKSTQIPLFHLNVF